MNILRKPMAFGAALLVTFIGGAFAQDLGGAWRLRVEGPKHELKASGIVRFSQESAPSCMAGDWKRVVVEAEAPMAKPTTFFPISGPLAYQVTDGTLVMGRTEVCDGYLFLIQPLENADIKGDYSAVSIGFSKRLGYFSLSQLPNKP